MRKIVVVLDDDADIQRVVFRYAKRIEPPIKLLQLFKLDDASHSLDAWLLDGSGQQRTQQRDGFGPVIEDGEFDFFHDLFASGIMSGA